MDLLEEEIEPDIDDLELKKDVEEGKTDIKPYAEDLDNILK